MYVSDPIGLLVWILVIAILIVILFAVLRRL